MASETQIFSREMILSAFKAVRQLSRTLYKSALFMQNKANLPEGKIDAKCVFTKDYEEKCGYGPQKNKPNQSQFQTRQGATY